MKIDTPPASDFDSQLCLARGVVLGQVQEALNALGFTDNFGQKLNVDGLLGNRTREATRKFQRSRGIKVDGCVGPETLGALRVALGQFAPPEAPPVPPAPPASEAPPAPPFTIEIDDEPKPAPKPAPKPEESSSGWWWALAGIAGAGAGVYYYRRRKGARR